MGGGKLKAVVERCEVENIQCKGIMYLYKIHWKVGSGGVFYTTVNMVLAFADPRSQLRF
jgi:hypothetical protein